LVAQPAFVSAPHSERQASELTLIQQWEMRANLKFSGRTSAHGVEHACSIDRPIDGGLPSESAAKADGPRRVSQSNLKP
jgi:hypothetical protein